MKAIFINSESRTITEVEVSGTNILDQWYKLIGCTIVEAAIYINKQEDCIMVDEEGMYNEPQTKGWFFYEGAHQPFVGNGLIVGHDDEGESISCSVSLEEVKLKVLFLTYAEAQATF